MTNKTYVVYGENGEELKTLKTLAAAKKLADAERGSILVDGECVYKAEPVVEEEAQFMEEETKPGEEQEIVEEETVEPEQTKVAKEKQHYRILSFMNIRSKPSRNGVIIGQVKPGTVVIAKSIDNDWLNTADGYILYGNGKYAEKV